MMRTLTSAWAVLVTAAAPLAAQAAPAPGEVTALGLESGVGRAALVVQHRGAVGVTDFLLTGPDRLVLDLKGARLAPGFGTGWDGVARGGVTNIRASQYRDDVVRVVLELEGAKDYDVEPGEGALRVTWAEPTRFAEWRSREAGALPRRVDRTTYGARVPAETFASFEPAGAATAPVTVRPASAGTAEQGFLRSAPGEQPRITANFDRASIADVVASFATFSGRTIILGKGVAGDVTAEIKNQPWHLAFQAILASQGLSAQEMPGGIIRVDAPSALASIDSLEPLETQVLRVNYANAGALVKTVESVLTKNRGRVVADTATNSLIITDTRSRMGSVGDFIRSLDIRTPQVSIQAKIVFVERTDIEQLGIRYDLGSRTQYFNRLVSRPDPLTGQLSLPGLNVVDLGGNQISAIGNAEQTIVNNALDLVFSTAIGGFSLTSFLQALERTELSDIQAEPLITTLDNTKAEIVVGEETPIRVIDAGAVAGVGQPPRATVQFRETGIKLAVTPHVTNNRQIQMTLETERSSIQPLAAADLGFVFQKQNAKNRLLVADGETAVIGGLTVTSVTKTRSGIPLLSGLPLVGKLFSFSSETEQRRDLIILVTPRIVDDGMGSAAN